MLRYDFEESIGYWLTIATQAYHRAIGEALAPHGITYRQSMVLGWLAIAGELSQNELAAKLMIEPPTLVGILDRMERDGWIVRCNCPEDRRKNLIRASDAAVPVWDKIFECALQVRERATQGMTDSQAATLRDLLKRMYDNIESRPTSNASRSCPGNGSDSQPSESSGVRATHRG